MAAESASYNCRLSHVVSTVIGIAIFLINIPMLFVWIRTFTHFFDNDETFLGVVSFLFITPGTFIFSWVADSSIGQDTLLWLALGAGLLLLAMLVEYVDRALGRRLKPR